MHAHLAYAALRWVHGGGGRGAEHVPRVQAATVEDDVEGVVDGGVVAAFAFEHFGAREEEGEREGVGAVGDRGRAASAAPGEEVRVDALAEEAGDA